MRLGAVFDGVAVNSAGVGHAEGHGAYRRPMHAGKCLGEAIGFAINDEIKFVLKPQRHVLGAVAGNCAKSQLAEQFAQFAGVRRGVFDEFETVRTQQIVPKISHGG